MRVANGTITPVKTLMSTSMGMNWDATALVIYSPECLLTNIKFNEALGKCTQDFQDMVSIRQLLTK